MLKPSLTLQIMLKKKWYSKKRFTFDDLKLDGFSYGLCKDSIFVEGLIEDESTVLYRKDRMARGIHVTLNEDGSELIFQLMLPTPPQELDDLLTYILEMNTLVPSDVYMHRTKMNMKKFRKRFFEQELLNNRLLIEVFQAIEQGNLESYQFLCLKNSIVVGPNEAKGYLNDTSGKYLATMFHKLQSDDYHRCVVKLYEHKKEEIYIGTYFVPLHKHVLLPLLPELPVEYDLLSAMPFAKAINTWRICFVNGDEVIGYIPYSQFFEVLVKSETDEFDYGHVILQPLIKEQVLAYIESSKQQNVLA